MTYNSFEEEYDPYLEEHLSQNSDESRSLDLYTETGVYIEENQKEDSDLLIVLGDAILPETRQFYINSNSLAYTRTLGDTWSAWFQIPPEKLPIKSLDFNAVLRTDYIITTGIEQLFNGPRDFPKANSSLDNIIISIRTILDHYVQFFIADDRRTFWIRNYSIPEGWSEWHIFN
ncbi:hypothetical protein [Chlamydiifrater volucris]|uniref:hypothetical protein n=1 Tax=Chlamydiifrater volucris TaxID=2681470 RepID=UPI001BCEDF56|nr:hypothetical protein [Chlamydiifrater volucris]